MLLLLAVTITNSVWNLKAELGLYYRAYLNPSQFQI